MGVVGISFDDFCRLTFEEIDEILKRWSEHSRDKIRSEWEQMRLHTYMMLKPFCSKLPPPKEMLPFAWDEPDEEEPEEAPMSEEERAASLKEKRQALGW